MLRLSLCGTIKYLMLIRGGVASLTDAAKLAAVLVMVQWLAAVVVQPKLCPEPEWSLIS